MPDRDANPNREEIEKRSSIPNDLPDSEKDMEKLKGDQVTINMPEVRDIPGQEHIHVPRMNEMADTTISSDDEEGRGILDTLNSGESEERTSGRSNSSDVTREEKETLRTGEEYYPSRDEDKLFEASMDNTDFEGEALNEKGFSANNRTGSDLDVPGAEDDDAMEDIGEEDEENNEWSLGGDDNAANEERTS